MLNTSMIFTTAKTKERAGLKKLSLEKRGFNVGPVQDLQTLSKIGAEGMFKRYASTFRINRHIDAMTEYIELWDILRMCCGLQMSKYWRNQLLKPSLRNPQLEPHPICGTTDIDDVERKFIGTSVYKLIDQYKHAAMLNKPSGGDGQLDGTYCSRYNAEVTRLGLNKLNSRSPRVDSQMPGSDNYLLKELIRNSSTLNTTNASNLKGSAIDVNHAHASNSNDQHCSILHVVQQGNPRTATTLQFESVSLCLFFHIREYCPTLLNTTSITFANKSTRWSLFYQNENVPQALKTHLGEFPNEKEMKMLNTSMIFTTAKTKERAGLKKLSLEKRGFNVGPVQDLQTLSKIGAEGMFKRYASTFRINRHIDAMTEYIELWDILRMCCGLQMSKYWRNQLLKPSLRNPQLEPHPICGTTDIDDVERKFIGTSVYKLIDQYKHAAMLNKPSGGDGQLDGTYCSRYNAEVTRLGLNKLNSRSPRVDSQMPGFYKDQLKELIRYYTGNNVGDNVRA